MLVLYVCRAQHKAKEAVAAVSAVQSASKQLGEAQVAATQQLGKLQQAAEQLSAIANTSATVPKAHAWDIGGIIKVRDTAHGLALLLALPGMQFWLSRTSPAKMSSKHSPSACTLKTVKHVRLSG